MKKRGISWTFSSAYTPQSNGLAKRMNRTLLNKTSSLLKCAEMSKRYWGEAFLHATNVYNRTSTNSLKEKWPYEAVLGKVPDNSHLRVFGCRANVYIHREQGRGKLGDRSKPGVLLAHRVGIYRVVDVDTRNVVESKQVTFNEREFPMRGSRNEEYNDEVYLSLDIEEEIEHRFDLKKLKASVEEEEIRENREGPRYHSTERNQPGRFVAGAMLRTHFAEITAIVTY